MSDQRLPLAFAALPDTRHCQERDSATKQSSAGAAPSPALDCFPPDLIRGSLAMTANGVDPRRTALVLTAAHPPLRSGERVGVRGDGGRYSAGEPSHDDESPSAGPDAARPPHPDPLPKGRGNEAAQRSFAVVRHAGSAAQAQAGACNCCRVPSDLVTVLRRLVIGRARGEIDISAVLVAGAPADLARLEQDALADPFVAARYVVHRET
jgi:hypothetical protein